MSPQDDPNVLTYNTPDFLDTVCHQNDTTDTDFADTKS